MEISCIVSSRFVAPILIYFYNALLYIDIATLFKQFGNFSVKLVWLDCTEKDSGIKKSELLTFKDLYSIRSYRKELNHCNALWKFIAFDQRHLFWSMAIYYSLIRTTTVHEWDQMFIREFDLIHKYGKLDYIHKDCEFMEQRKERRKQREEERKQFEEERRQRDKDRDKERRKSRTSSRSRSRSRDRDKDRKRARKGSSSRSPSRDRENGKERAKLEQNEMVIDHEQD